MTRTYATLGPDGKIAAGYAAASLGTYPVSYWRLGEPSGTVAKDEMGAYAGTYIGSPTLGAAGLLTGDSDTAMHGNGGSPPCGLQITGGVGVRAAWSIGMWVRPDASQTYGAYSYTRLFATTGYVMEIGWDTTTGNINVYNGSWHSLGITVPLGSTTNLVLTYDGTNLSAYINGALVYGPTAGVGAALTAVTCYFGTDAGGTQDNFLGTTDDPIIWGRALTAAEIATLYAARTTAPAQNRSGGALPKFTPTSTTAFRLSTYRDVYLIVPVTFNPTAIATATCLVEISPDNATWTTIVTRTAPMLAALAGSIDTVDVMVPAGWYVRLTTTLATLGAATWY